VQGALVDEGGRRSGERCNDERSCPRSRSRGFRLRALSLLVGVRAARIFDSVSTWLWAKAEEADSPRAHAPRFLSRKARPRAKRWQTCSDTTSSHRERYEPVVKECLEQEPPPLEKPVTRTAPSSSSRACRRTAQPLMRSAKLRKYECCSVGEFCEGRRGQRGTARRRARERERTHVVDRGAAEEGLAHGAEEPWYSRRDRVGALVEGDDPPRRDGRERRRRRRRERDRVAAAQPARLPIERQARCRDVAVGVLVLLRGRRHGRADDLGDERGAEDARAVVGLEAAVRDRDRVGERVVVDEGDERAVGRARADLADRRVAVVDLGRRQDELAVDPAGARTRRQRLRQE